MSTEKKRGGTHGPRGQYQPLSAAADPDALLTLANAAALVGLSESTLYRRVQLDPTFPRLVKLGTRATRIRAGDLRRWIAAQSGRLADLAGSEARHGS